MPVLDRVTGAAILDRTSPAEYISSFRREAARQRIVAGAPLLQPLDERVLRVMLTLHASGRHFATPIGIAQRLGKKTSSVRHSLARLRLLRLLPFEVRL